ncbi:hypothetical protein M3P36_11910 [Altererythrobacter sp. KTW20L]|uniref:hypothetical protein n=1 Tax=Altererythrobacter sp. KTW20L TaxID=2942210 RepID=UPI0020C016D8|nr:hypothetical protein [Altererythrobacter sp. KTW20L]MCL6251742.1 hypothetical protein [Altererythrobacter sp. KTW20L]
MNIPDLTFSELFSGSSARISTTLNIQGTALEGGASRNFGTFAYDSLIEGNTISTACNRCGLRGTFYGPKADEVAAIFGISAFNGEAGGPPSTERTDLDGLFLGRKAP